MPDTDTATASQNPMFEANMEAFEKFSPEAYRVLAAVGSPYSKIVILPDDGIDMSFQGQTFYGRDALVHTQEQVDSFVSAPLRWTFNRPHPDNLGRTCGGYVQELEKAITSVDIDIGPDLSNDKSEFIIVFGIGLGLHLAPLIEHTEARSVVLVEPMIENLYHSLFVLDWVSLFDEAEKDGRQFYFVLKDETAAISAAVLKHLRRCNPALLDGVYVFRHYASSVLANVYERVQRDFFLNISGLGFFEDEVIMTANGCGNLGASGAKVIDRQLPHVDVPLFIVGSGPSVDSQIAIIKKHREKAVVMSIGSGLRVLLAYGIRPDYHVELENGIGTAHVIDLVKQEFGLQGVTLLASLTVRPEVADAFDEVFFFFRESVSSTSLFGQDIRKVWPAGPTVANSALGVAIRFGFSRLFLFGVDMGGRRRDAYHSSKSLYGTGLLRDVDPEHAIKGSAPGNFGGTAYFDNVLSWSRYSLEGVLRALPYVECINCSDGTRIAGARPQLPETLVFDGDEVDRAAVKSAIRDGTTHFTSARRDDIWRTTDLPGQCSAVFAAFRKVLDSATPEDERMGWGDALFELVRKDKQVKDTVIRTYMYGTVVLMLGCAQWYAARLADRRQGVAYRAIALDGFRKTVDEMEERLGALLGDVQAFFDGRREDIPVSEDVSVDFHPKLAALVNKA